MTAKLLSAAALVAATSPTTQSRKQNHGYARLTITKRARLKEQRRRSRFAEPDVVSHCASAASCEALRKEMSRAERPAAARERKPGTMRSLQQIKRAVKPRSVAGNGVVSPGTARCGAVWQAQVWSGVAVSNV